MHRFRATANAIAEHATKTLSTSIQRNLASFDRPSSKKRFPEHKFRVRLVHRYSTDTSSESPPSSVPSDDTNFESKKGTIKPGEEGTEPKEKTPKPLKKTLSGKLPVDDESLSLEDLAASAPPIEGTLWTEHEPENQRLVLRAAKAWKEFDPRIVVIESRGNRFHKSHRSPWDEKDVLTMRLQGDQGRQLGSCHLHRDETWTLDRPSRFARGKTAKPNDSKASGEEKDGKASRENEDSKAIGEDNSVKAKGEEGSKKV